MGGAVAQAGGLWAGTRLAFVVVTYFAVVLASQYTMKGLNRGWLFGGGVPSAHAFLTAWGQWDYGWFSGIAGHGYTQQSSAFFPLYPALMHVGFVLITHLGKSPPTALLESGLVISNLAALIAFIATWLLIRTASDDDRVARLTVLFMVAFPYAFFLAAPYSESLFLAAVAISLLCARKGYWLPSVAAAYLAGLTRSTAVVLVLPLVWEFARQHGWFGVGRWRMGWGTVGRWMELGLGLVVLLAVPAAIATYMLYLARTFHDPLAFVHAESLPGWTRRVVPPWQTVGLFLGHLEAQPRFGFWQLLIGFEGLLILAFGVATILAVRYIPASFVLFAAGVVTLILITPVTNYVDPFLGVGRYLLVAFPVFFAMAKLSVGRPTLSSATLFGGVLLQGVLTSFWLTGGWLA